MCSVGGLPYTTEIIELHDVADIIALHDDFLGGGGHAYKVLFMLLQSSESLLLC